jgi:hypothetical protein
MACRAAQDIAGCQRIAGRTAPVGDQDGLVGAAVERIAEDRAGRGQAHRDDGDVPAELVLDLQGQFEGVEVFRVEDGRQGGTLDCPVVVHHVARNPFGIRHLLYQHNAVISQRFSPLSSCMD